MVRHIDTEGDFEITGEFDFRNAAVFIAIGASLPTIVRDNGQLFYSDDGAGNFRLYYTVNGAWFYKTAI